MNITTAAPVEIDEALAEIFGRYYAADDQAMMVAHQIQEATKRNADIEAGGRAARYYSVTSPERLAELQAKLEAATAAAQTILAETVPLNDEFLSRGGWTRAYLVQPGGHVHSSMSCQTCYPTTRFGWLTQMSDHTEAEIVELAGEGACSVCYPTAPRIGRNRLELPADKAAREVRQAEKAARDAKKAAKAISNPDGTPLMGRWGLIASVVTAWNTVVGNIADSRAYGYQSRGEENARIVAALVAKTGDTEAAVLAKIEGKVAARIKREAAAR